MPFSSTSVEPDLQPAIELAFEAAWRELRLTPGRVLTTHNERSTRAELARRVMAAAAEGERDPLRLKLKALRAAKIESGVSSSTVQLMRLGKRMLALDAAVAAASHT